MDFYGRKMKLLLLQKILEEQTDEEHFLTANQLADRLKVFGISAERKGIYDDIAALNAYYKPTDKKKQDRAQRIEKDEEGRGYYLTNRLFSVSDLKLMIDAIQSSKFLSDAKTLELIEALETLCSKHQAQGFKRQVIVSNRVKNMNIKVHNNVDHLNYAIVEDWQVKFKYFDYDTKQQRAFRKKGGWYIVSPFALVYYDDNYYLLGYDEEKGKIMNYRVDRMAYVSAQEGKIREGKDVFAALDLAQYQRYTFSMYSGEVQRVTMRFRNNMMNAVIDKFGKLGYVKEVDKDHFEVTVSVAVSPQFFGWVFGLGNYVTIVGPEDVKEKMKKMLDSVRRRYD